MVVFYSAKNMPYNGIHKPDFCLVMKYCFATFFTFCTFGKCIRAFWECQQTEIVFWFLKIICLFFFVILVFNDSTMYDMDFMGPMHINLPNIMWNISPCYGKCNYSVQDVS